MCKQFVHLSRYLAGQFCEKGWPRALWARRMKRESCLGDNNFFTSFCVVGDETGYIFETKYLKKCYVIHLDSCSATEVTNASCYLIQRKKSQIDPTCAVPIQMVRFALWEDR